MKGERKVEREEQKQLIPKVAAPWTFEQLPDEERSHLRDFSQLPRDNWIVIFRFCFAGDIISCGRVSKGLLSVSLDEHLWRAKLYDDWNITCEVHKAMPAREAYLALASRGRCAPGSACVPRRPFTSFIEMYHLRARKWLNESIKVSGLVVRCRALRVANGVVDHGSRSGRPRCAKRAPSWARPSTRAPSWSRALSRARPATAPLTRWRPFSR